jgi:hypothetical protein
MLPISGFLIERIKISTILSLGGVLSVLTALIFTCHTIYIKRKKNV